MPSNQKFMIASLLNLYVNYIKLKNEKTRDDKSTHHNFKERVLKIQSDNVARTNQNFQMQTVPISKMERAPLNNDTQLSHNDETNNDLSDSNKQVSLASSSGIKRLGSHFANNQEIKTNQISNSEIKAQIEDLLHSSSDSNLSSGIEILDSASNIQEHIINQNELVSKKTVIKRNKKSLNAIKKKRVRRWGVRPTNHDRARSGYHRKVFANIKTMSKEDFFLHTRMTKPLFDWLLTFVTNSLKKKRQTVGAEERLALTLNYLAYGTKLQSIAFRHKLGKSTARIIVLETCITLWDLLSPIYLNELTTSQYADIADDFKSKLKLPNCVGAIQGKHVKIHLNNVKKNGEPPTVIVMGVCDTSYKFTAVSLGFSKTQNDEEIFRESSFGSLLLSDNLPLPSNKPLYPSLPPFPHYFISNTSLPLRKNIMRPYLETELDAANNFFNNNIARALAVAENTFGILAARWRALLTLEFLGENCKTIILACIVLHNFIMTNDEDNLYCPDNFVDSRDQDGETHLGEWRGELEGNGDQPLRNVMPNEAIKSTYEAYNLRDILANYFLNEEISYEMDIN